MSCVLRMGLKVEQQSPPINVAKEEQPFVWPWVGVLANIPLEWKDERFVGPSDFILEQQLAQRGFNTLKVQTLWSHRGHSGFALVKFEKDFNGLEHATLFDESFQASHCGNRDWNVAMGCSADKLYGWIAREDDYKFEGIVGQHLRKFRDLMSISDMREEEDRKTMLLLSDLNNTNLSKRMHHKEMHSRVDDISFRVDDLMKQKDEMVQRYNEDIRKTHHSAQKHPEKIISQREKAKVLLEAQKQEIQMRSTELVEGEVQNEIELRKIQNEKYMKDKEKLRRRIIDLEKEVDNKQVLELEIERMRYMGDAGDKEILEKMDTIQEQLKEKEEEYNRFEAMNQTLIVKHQRSNGKLQGARKELIKYLEEGSRNLSTGVKKGGDLDFKPFLAVAKRKYSEENAYGKAMDLYSEWKDYLHDPSWQPFVTAEGSNKEEIDIDDERLKCLRNEQCDEVYNAVTKALLEMNEYTNGRYAAFILKQRRVLKKRRS